jgi:hypothetical protein
VRRVNRAGTHPKTIEHRLGDLRVTVSLDRMGICPPTGRRLGRRARRERPEVVVERREAAV